MVSLLQKLLIFVNFAGIRHCISDSSQQFITTRLDIDTDIRYRFAETVYTLTVYNPGNRNQTYIVDIPYPKQAFVSNFTIETDGQIFSSKIIEKKNQGNSTQDGHRYNDVSTRFQDTASFVMPVDIPAKNDVTIRLTYQEVLRRRKGVYSTKVIVSHCEYSYNTRVQFSIKETKRLINIKAKPSWERGDNRDLPIVRPSHESAVIMYQTISNDEQCLQQLSIEYDVERNQSAGEILIEDGFFVHFLAPTGLQAIPKDIVFVLDTSRSMTGDPIAELQRAMNTILDKLASKDRFNIIVFQTTFGLFESELQNTSSQAILSAKDMINFQTPGGGTNIHDGLLAGVKMLHSVKVKEIRSPVIIFLTDGHASTGITNSDLIAARIKTRNKLGIPIFSISLGKDADKKLSTKVAAQNFGFSKHIYEPKTSNIVINDLYDDVATTVMKHINIYYFDDIVNNRTLTQTKFRTLFNKSEIVTSGKFVNDSITFLNSRVVGIASSGLTVLSNASVTVIQDVKHKNTLKAIWQHNRLKEAMKIRNALDNPDLLEKLNKSLLSMSLQYNYITPMTAAIISQNGQTHISDIVDNDERVSYAAAYKIQEEFERKRYGVSRFSGKGDPHFEVSIKGIEFPVCFDVKATPGAVIQILQKPKEIILNIGIIPETTWLQEDKQYISDLFISVKGHKALFNVYSGILYKWFKIRMVDEKL